MRQWHLRLSPLRRTYDTMDLEGICLVQGEDLCRVVSSEKAPGRSYLFDANKPHPWNPNGHAVEPDFWLHGPFARLFVQIRRVLLWDGNGSLIAGDMPGIPKIYCAASPSEKL